MKQFLTVLIFLMMGYFSATFITKQMKKNHADNNEKISKLNNRVNLLEGQNKELKQDNNKLTENIKVKEIDLKDTKNVKEDLAKKLNELIKTNNELLTENKNMNDKIDLLTKMNTHDLIKKDLEELKNNCTAKKKARKKKRIYKWVCKNKEKYNQCTINKSREWDRKCRGVSKYIRVKRKMVYKKQNKEYDLSDRTLVKEKNHITEIIPAHFILNPKFPSLCKKGKQHIPSDCSSLHCY